jgi:hypothetical protein
MGDTMACNIQYTFWRIFIKKKKIAKTIRFSIFLLKKIKKNCQNYMFQHIFIKKNKKKLPKLYVSVYFY